MRITRETGIWIGAIIGTVTFLGAGLVPALLYGGYLAVMVESAWLGQPMATGGLGGYFVMIGMVVGAAAVWFLFMVLGSAMGALASWGFDKVLTRSR